GHLQHGIGQNQLTQGNQLNRHMGQFSGQANSTLFNTSQTVPNAPLIPNMSAAMASQSLLPRMQNLSRIFWPTPSETWLESGHDHWNLGRNPATAVRILVGIWAPVVGILSEFKTLSESSSKSDHVGI
ncbi:Mediator of RNA polymerase II transcription subunit 8-like protein, partial [Drosera capensis]